MKKTHNKESYMDLIMAIVALAIVALIGAFCLSYIGFSAAYKYEPTRSLLLCFSLRQSLVLYAGVLVSIFTLLYVVLCKKMGYLDS